LSLSCVLFRSPGALCHLPPFPTTPLFRSVECLDLGGADAGRAGPEASVGGQEFVWDRYLRRSHSRHSTAGGPGPDIGPSYGDRDQPFGGDRAPGPACWPNTRTHAMTRVRAGT